ncbi:MAG: HesA/MoeB/ThiF family protein [Magnetococcales bacterium]|nr:HesA/MoeB/ThiF family protein [Magnetococcales bacterium]
MTTPSSLLLLGAGGLGTAVALALAAAAPGLCLIVADPDRVALSNLHRQVAYRSEDVGRLKVEALAARLPQLAIQCQAVRLDTTEAIVSAASGCTLIVDGTDNFASRFAANDAALQSGLPLVHGAVTGYFGQVMSIQPGQSACLRCLFDAPPATEPGACQREGVVGPLVGEVGWLMALEAIKWISRSGTPLLDRLLTIDLLHGVRRPILLRRQQQCKGCGSTSPT